MVLGKHSILKKGRFITIYSHTSFYTDVLKRSLHPDLRRNVIVEFVDYEDTGLSFTRCNMLGLDGATI